MRATASIPSVRKGKQRLLGSCAIAAGLAALAIGGPALAQVQGTGQVVTGSGPGGTATIRNPGTGAPANTTQVIANTGQTIINWTPTDTGTDPAAGAIDFLQTGNTLEFYGTGQYTVLNRFIGPAAAVRPIGLNGTVNSYVGAPTPTGGGIQGGNIWFYNAGGILIGSQASINVGSLVLTANDIDTTGGLFGPGGEIRFRGAAGGTSTVQIAAGADITLANGNPGDSYFAVVAPRIVQSGVVSVDGSTAYVAAEQADITINNGLFDINVLVGAEGGNVITHTGVTTGPAHQQGDVDQSRVYMVAIPKNDAVTMLVAGQVGYQDALVAQTDPDGAVRLSAGYNIVGGEIADTPVNATPANITIADSIFQSSVTAHASGDMVAGPLATIPPPGGPVVTLPPPQIGRIIVQGDGNFIGDASATLNVGAGQLVGATGDFNVTSGGDAIANITGGQFIAVGDFNVASTGAQQADGSSQGGSATLSVTGGQALVAGAITVTSTGAGGIGVTNAGGDGTGGAASLLVSGAGTTLAADSIAVQSIGTGGGLIVDVSGEVSAVDSGGDGIGGDATLTVQNGGNLTVNGLLAVASTGTGQTGNVQSGAGTGGTARIELSGSGSVINAAATSVAATGVGGSDFSQIIFPDVVTENGGDGVGGTAELFIDGDSSTSAALGDVAVSADGEGGGARGGNPVAGDGRGGSATVTATGGVLATPDSLTVSAVGRGGGASGATGFVATGGDGFGGNATVTADSASSLAVDGIITLDASAEAQTADNVGSSQGGTVLVQATGGGSITALDEFAAFASAGQFTSAVDSNVGSSTGGDIDFVADGGTISASFFTLGADAATRNVDQTGGAAQGGTVDLLATNGGLIAATNPDQFSFVSADAVTGFSNGGAGATGGTVQVIADGGTISYAGGAGFSAGGVSGGDSNFGATGTPQGLGGTILFRTTDSASAILFSDLFASSDGAAGAVVEGSPSFSDLGSANGVGGIITVDIQDGLFSGTTAFFSASGFGGAVAASGGTGQGGTATFTQTGGTVTIDDLIVDASGSGGVGFSGSPAGTGIGGTATINLFGGTLDAISITASADGNGGFAFSGDDDPVDPQVANDGGNGQGGTATINLEGTAVVSADSVAAFAGGFGGDGGDFFSSGGNIGDSGTGGDGTGGDARVNLVSGTLTTDDLLADASGFGGNGGQLFDSSSSGPPTGIGIGGNGGNGQGGTATIDFETTITANGSVVSASSGFGGNGGFNSIGGNGGDGGGGLAQIIVDDFDAGTLAVTVDSSAFGGNGGFGQQGDGGDGGTAIGGVARIQATGPNANATVSQANFITDATGGTGGGSFAFFGATPLVGPAGGDGGDGVGGTVEVVASDGATVSLAIDPLTGTATFSSTGTGGNGGNGADNFGSVVLPGPDGMLGTPDDQTVGVTGGDGGIGGGGSGGTVHLLADAGTITSNGGAVNIGVSGVSGTGGNGGTGSGANGNAGGNFADQGGRVSIEAFSSGNGPGQISFGDTAIAANGTFAGRIEIRTDNIVTMASLSAEALGLADPTNSDTDLAPRGIFLAPTGGTIQTDGAMSLTTGSSVGVYAQAGGQLNVGGDLSVDAGDQVDIRHDFGDGTTSTIQTGGSASFTAVSTIRGAPGSLVSAGTSLTMNASGFNSAIDVDSLDAQTLTLLLAANGRINVYGSTTSGDDLTANAGGEVAINDATAGDDIALTGGTLVLGTLTADASAPDPEFNGSSITLASTGAATVDHAEADGDFIADVGSFSTGLNSIITGGSIIITSPGAVDLGNSDAGGFVSVDGQSIAFNSIVAGSSVDLGATGTAPGAEGIAGGSIDAGSTVNLSASRIAIDGTIDTDGSIFANSSAGPVAIALANAGGTIAIVAAGDLTGTYNADSDIRLTAGGDIDASANAIGFETSSSGPPIAASVYVDAAGSVTLADSSASGMFGVNAGQSATLDGATVGEDVLVLAGTTAALTGVVAGDDLTVSAGGGITANGVTTDGSGPDDRTLSYGSGFFQTSFTAPDLSNTTLTASAGTIGGSDIAAFDNLTLTASGAVTTTGTLVSGLATSISGGSLAIEAIDAGTDITLASTGAATVDHAEADGNFFADVGSFSTGLNSIITGGNIQITSPGAVDLGNSDAGGFVSVDGQSIAFNSIVAGTFVSLFASGTTPGADGIAGGSIGAGSGASLDATRIAVTGPVTGSGSLFANGSAGPVAIGLATIDGSIFVSADGDITGTYNATGDISLTSGADIAASANAIGFESSSSGTPIAASLFADAAGNVTLDDSSASGMFGVNAGQSATLDGATAGEDMLVLAGTTAALTDVSAGDDLNVSAAGGITANGVATTGTGPDDRTLSYGSGFFQTSFTAPDLSNATLTASAGTIGGGDIAAFDNLTLTASGAVTTTGTLQSGLATNVTGSSLSFEAITAGTDIVLTATLGGIASTGALAAGHDLTLVAATAVDVSELDAGDDIAVDAGGAVAIGAAYSYGTGLDNEGDGSNVFITGGATTVDHAEANDDFTANVGSFATGLNSLITGGDILIVSAGAADLGNSTAGGFISVNAQSVAFNALDAGDFVDLFATGTAPGAEGIAGGSIVAATDVTLTGNSIAVDSIAAGASLAAAGNGGDVAIADAQAAGFIDVFADGNLTGAYTSGGDIALASNADIDASANASGGFPDPDNGDAPSAGNAYVVAAGDVALTDSSAAGMLGVSAGGSATVTNAAAGEDMLVLAGTTANVSGATAGDNLGVVAGGTVTVANSSATGAGPDGFSLVYSTANGFGIVAGEGSLPVDGADIMLTSTGGGIVATGLSAGDDIVLTAANGAVAVDGATTLGLGTTGGDSSIVSTSQTGSFSSLDSHDDVILTIAAGTTPLDDLTVGRDLIVDANALSGDMALAAGRDIAITTNADLALGDLDAGRNLTLFSGGDVAIGAGNSGGFIEIDGLSIAFAALDAAGFVDLAALDAAPGGHIGGSAIVAGDSVSLFGQSIAIETVTTGGSLSASAGDGTVAIGQATAADFIGVSAGGDITGNYEAQSGIIFRAGGDILASAAATGFESSSSGPPITANVFADADGDVVLTDSSATGMFGVNAGGSVTLTGATAGEDMLVLAGTTATLSAISVGDDLDVIAAGAVDVTGASATGDGPDGFTIFFDSSEGFLIGQGEGGASTDGADIDLRSTSGSITAAALSAGDDIVLDAATALSVSGATTLGLGITGGDSSIRAQGGNATFAGLDAADDIDIDSTGAVGVTGPATAGRDVTIDAASVTVATLTDTNSNLVETIVADRDLAITASGSIEAGSIEAGRDLTLAAGTTVGVQRAVNGAGGVLALDGAEGVTGDRIVGGGETSLTSDGGAIMIASLSSAGPVTARGDSISIGGPGSLVFGELSTDVGDAFVSASGNLSVTQGNVAGLATLRSTSGDLAVTQLEAADVRLAADDDMTLGTVTATDTLIADAGGVLTVNNGVTGREMSVGSGDIVLAANGRLGTGGSTEILDVRNTDEDSQTFVGGTGSRDGYHLDADEMTRLFGNDVTIFAPVLDGNNSSFTAAAPGGLPIGSVGSSARADVVIDDFTITAGGSTANLGASGSLSIVTPGKARVIGDVRLTGMSDANAFNIFADDALEVILGEGSILLTGTGTALGGMLNLQSEDVIVATADAIAAVGAATTTDAIDARLAQNDGILLDQGAIAAGGIDVGVVGGFYVQNSGADDSFDARRGLTFGPLGLNVNTEGSDTRIVINGVHLGPNGTVTGLDAIPLLTINGTASGQALPGDFDQLSTMNGCVIVNPASCAIIVPEFETSFPVQDVIEDEVEGEDGAEGMSLPQPLITMRELDPLTGEPLLDDPVTGAGNDDLWTPPGE